MLRRVVPCCALTLAALAGAPSPARAQAVLGVGDDALVLPRGVLRIRTLYQVAEFDERYGMNTPGRESGALEPLAIDFNLDTVGVTTFRNLAPLETGLRSLSGISTFGLSLGRTIVNADVTVTATPIVAEFGLTENLSIGLLVPIVRTRNEVFFQANPEGSQNNVAFNPALAVQAARDQNTTLVLQLLGAAETLETGIESSTAPGYCQTAAGAATSGCTLVNSTRTFAGGIAGVYGTNPITGLSTAGSPFVPLESSDVQLAIEARIAAFDQAYQGALGSDVITATAPFGAVAPLSTADAQTILTNAAFGINADPLETIERTGLGDIELGAKFRVLDTFAKRGASRFTPSGINYRASLGANVRFGTGEEGAANNFVDVGTGNGQTDIEGRAFVDVLLGRRFWTSVVGRYGIQLADKQTMRITDVPERALAPQYREHLVDRDLGDYYEFEAVPRLMINKYFGIAGTYFYRHKYEDRYEGTFMVPAAVTGFGDLELNAATLNQQTEAFEHRFGGGFTFSTLAAFDEGKARIPLELIFHHFQTTRGYGGNVPKLFVNQLQLRVYARLFGG
jgi:hypothetical protein